jgi:hypothetical protein
VIETKSIGTKTAWEETSSTMDSIYHAFRAQTGGVARNRPAPPKDRRMTEAVSG